MNEKDILEEKILTPASGAFALFIILLCFAASIASFVFGIINLDSGNTLIGAPLLILGLIFGFIVLPISCAGLKIIKPNEALVLTLFGKYYGSIKQDGFFYVNPFVTAVNPAYTSVVSASLGVAANTLTGHTNSTDSPVTQPDANLTGKKLSLKAMTLNNKIQKVNDQLGNPIMVGVIVIWKINNTVKAVFNVDNYMTFLSTQADSALRNVCRLFPYDVSNEGDEKSLRGSSQEVAECLKSELQQRVEVAGLDIIDIRITNLSYAPEIAAAMLQRQQATAIIEARQKIVEGAVSMVEMALNKLSENDICELDEERKAAMVSNLLVVLCGNKDAQPIVNSGSIY